MGVRRIQPDESVDVFTSRLWQTNCTVVRDGDRALVIDALPFPDEQDYLRNVLEGEGAEVERVLATQADWDHAIAAAAFPSLALTSSERTAAQLAEAPEELAACIRRFDLAHYVDRPPYEPAAFETVELPGTLAVGEQTVELVPTSGYANDGLAAYLPWCNVLVAGEYLSPLEIARIGPTGSVQDYLETLERLRPLIERAKIVIPAHGFPYPGERALAVLEEDRTYLESLPDEAAIPAGRDTEEQRRVHLHVNAPRA